MSTGTPGSPGGGSSSRADRLMAGLWGFLKILADGNATPDFELAPSTVGSCYEWDAATSETNTNHNGYGGTSSGGPVTPTTTIYTIDSGKAAVSIETPTGNPT